MVIISSFPNLNRIKRDASGNSYAAPKIVKKKIINFFYKIDAPPRLGYRITNPPRHINPFSLSSISRITKATPNRVLHEYQQGIVWHIDRPQRNGEIYPNCTGCHHCTREDATRHPRILKNIATRRWDTNQRSR